jgi:hypothetical protein
LTFKPLSRDSVSSCIFLTASRYWDFRFSSVIHFRLAWSAKNTPPRKTASDVAAVSEIVLVGILNHVKNTGVNELLEVGKDKTPLPGTDLEVGKDTDLVLIELDLLDIVAEEFELDEVLVTELELPELLKLLELLELENMLEEELENVDGSNLLWEVILEEFVIGK